MKLGKRKPSTPSPLDRIIEQARADIDATRADVEPPQPQSEVEPSPERLLDEACSRVPRMPTPRPIELAGEMLTREQAEERHARYEKKATTAHREDTRKAWQRAADDLWRVLHPIASADEPGDEAFEYKARVCRSRDCPTELPPSNDWPWSVCNVCLAISHQIIPANERTRPDIEPPYNGSPFGA